MSKPIYVVSGLPRSGTSMMMQMLTKGGLPPLCDGIREADEDNPRGYLELEAVKATERDASWVANAPGRVVKVVSSLLVHLPKDYEYRVIFMRRQLDEVLASQRRMLGRRGEPLGDADAMRTMFVRHIEEMEHWLRNAPHMKQLFVSYNRLLVHPQEQLERVRNFLHVSVDETAMLSAIDPTLHRQRADQSEPSVQVLSSDHTTPLRSEREALLQQKGAVLWFTGLSGAGKTTIARALEKRLMASGRLCYVLDGDNVRAGINRDLGFSPDDRAENIRRVGELAAMFADCGVLTLTSFISPYRAGRDHARSITDRFVEIFVDAPIQTCEKRDPKGLYHKVRLGEITSFTGISAPYEAPNKPELHLDTTQTTLDDCVAQILAYLTERKMIVDPL